MSKRSWWRDRTFSGKAIVVISTLLLIQICLTLSTNYTVLPAVEAITGETWRGELGPFVLFFIQVLLCIPTLILLIAAIAIRAIIFFRGKGPIVSPVPAITLSKTQGDEQQNP